MVMKKSTTLLLILVSLFILAQPTMSLTYTVSVPAGTKYCYITGEMNGWNPGKHMMTKVNDNTFTIDIETATETMKYQYLSGPDWKYIEKDANGDAIQDRTWSELDVVEKWLETFTPDEREVTIEALVPSAVKVLYMVGSFNGWSSPSEDYKMQLIENTIDGKVFSIKVFSLDAINMEFKFVAGPAWAYEQTDPKDNFIYGSTENTVSVVVNSFKEYFDPEKTGTINIRVNVPVGTNKVFLQGDHLGWNMDNAVEATKIEDGVFSVSAPMVISISYRMYNKPDWGYPEVNEEGNERANREARYPEDANTEITVIGWKKTDDTSVQTFKPDTKNNFHIVGSRVFIENVISKVEIFDISGRMLQSKNIRGTFKSENLNKGIYIIRVDNSTEKISIF